MAAALAARLAAARERLDARDRAPAARRAARREPCYEAAAQVAPAPRRPRTSCASSPAPSPRCAASSAARSTTSTRPRGGAFLVAAADLLGSTSVNTIAAGFADGFWNARTEPGRAPALDRRHLRGRHGRRPLAASPPSATTSASARPTAPSWRRSATSRRACTPSAPRRARPSPASPYKPMILVCAHAGLKTGEDGPTHADPQPLQLLQENFPRGTAITLTPVGAAGDLDAARRRRCAQRPAVIAPFVTRPNETVLDRAGARPGAGRGGGRPASTCCAPSESPRRHGRAAGERRRLRLRRGGAAAPGGEGRRRAGLLRRERRALRPAAARTSSARIFPEARAARGHRHHRLHAADAVPLGALRRRPRRQPLPVPQGPLPRQRPGRGGAGRGRPRRREPGRGHPALHRRPRGGDALPGERRAPEQAMAGRRDRPRLPGAVASRRSRRWASAGRHTARRSPGSRSQAAMLATPRAAASAAARRA